MKTQKNILIAFVLNLFFSVFEFFGGIITGSVAILSDSLHDLGDALSIGISFFLEKKSKKQPDETYTYGYARFSLLGGIITTVILIIGSIAVIYKAVLRIINPADVNYKGMIVFAIIGVAVNFLAVYFTKDGESVNQRAVNLHMLEDVLGWFAVLVGAIIMHFTSFSLLDPVLSLAVSGFILINAVRNLFSAITIFLEKSPVNTAQIKEHILEIEQVIDVHHIHIRKLDEEKIYATMHVVTNGDAYTVKKAVKEELHHLGVVHATLELETELEHCEDKECTVEEHERHHHHHHH